MDHHHIRHVPVFEGGTVIGVISIRDILALRGGIAGQPLEEAGRDVSPSPAS
jgi:CBS domain-containing protein